MENQLPITDSNARVVVTGASRGIGRAISIALALNRHSVLGLSRTKPEELAGLTQPADSYLAWKRLDLSDVADVADCAASLKPIAVRALILSAVDYGADARHPSELTSAQQWQKVIATNCIGQCLLVSCLLPKLVANAPGIIINVSSDVALLPGPGRSAYAASKAGLHAMLRAVEAEYSVNGLRVYQLVPTFQLLTDGIRRRRPIDFDFSSYVDPALIGQVVEGLLSSSGPSTASGTYLVHRDGTVSRHSEVAQI